MIDQLADFVNGNHVLVRRGRDTSLETERVRFQVKRMIAIAALSVIGASDTLLSHGIGVYPLACVPAAGAIVLGLLAVLKHDALHSRGL